MDNQAVKAGQRRVAKIGSRHSFYMEQVETALGKAMCLLSLANVYMEPRA